MHVEKNSAFVLTFYFALFVKISFPPPPPSRCFYKSGTDGEMKSKSDGALPYDLNQTKTSSPSLHFPK